MDVLAELWKQSKTHEHCSKANSCIHSSLIHSGLCIICILTFPLNSLCTNNCLTKTNKQTNKKHAGIYKSFCQPFFYQQWGIFTLLNRSTKDRLLVDRTQDSSTACISTTAWIGLVLSFSHSCKVVIDVLTLDCEDHNG